MKCLCIIKIRNEWNVAQIAFSYDSTRHCGFFIIIIFQIEALQSLQNNRQVEFSFHEKVKLSPILHDMRKNSFIFTLTYLLTLRDNLHFTLESNPQYSKQNNITILLILGANQEILFLQSNLRIDLSSRRRRLFNYNNLLFKFLPSVAHRLTTATKNSPPSHDVVNHSPFSSSLRTTPILEQIPTN